MLIDNITPVVTVV